MEMNELRWSQDPGICCVDSVVFDFPLYKVGAYLKTPCYPIWVVCSESHFSVLFALQRELLTNQDKGLEFDLYYYDGLANQQEEIRLTVCMWHHLLHIINAHVLSWLCLLLVMNNMNNVNKGIRVISDYNVL